MGFASAQPILRVTLHDTVPTLRTFPGRSAARSGALQARDPYELGAIMRRACEDPGPAVHRSAALHAAPHPGNAAIFCQC